jgi:hypothetical protein
VSGTRTKLENGDENKTVKQKSASKIKEDIIIVAGEDSRNQQCLDR